ncbi:glutaminase [Bacillus sp. SL00103]
MGRRNSSVLQKWTKRWLHSSTRKSEFSQLGISVIGPDGSSVRYGDWDVPLPQSISKVISFYSHLFRKRRSLRLDRVDVEPTGDALIPSTVLRCINQGSL